MPDAVTCEPLPSPLGRCAGASVPGLQVDRRCGGRALVAVPGEAS